MKMSNLIVMEIGLFRRPTIEHDPLGVYRYIGGMIL